MTSKVIGFYHAALFFSEHFLAIRDEMIRSQSTKKRKGRGNYNPDFFNSTDNKIFPLADPVFLFNLTLLHLVVDLPSRRQTYFSASGRVLMENLCPLSLISPEKKKRKISYAPPF
jgi:hypothetical protein